MYDDKIKACMAAHPDKQHVVAVGASPLVKIKNHPVAAMNGWDVKFIVVISSPRGRSISVEELKKFLDSFVPAIIRSLDFSVIENIVDFEIYDTECEFKGTYSIVKNFSDDFDSYSYRYDALIHLNLN